MGLLTAAAIAGSAILGAKASSSASKSASRAARDSSRDQVNLQRELYFDNQERQQPFYDIGRTATNALAREMGITSGPAPSIGQFKDASGDTVYFVEGAQGDGPFGGKRGWHSKDKDEIEGWISDNPVSINRDAQMRAPEQTSWRDDPLFRTKPKQHYERYAAEDFENSLYAMDKPGDYRRSKWSENPLNRSFEWGEFEEDPGYQFRMDEATKALQRNAAAQGLSLSGASMEALNREVQGIAAQGYNDWFGQQLARSADQQNAYSTYEQLMQGRQGQARADRQQYFGAVGAYQDQEARKQQGFRSDLAAYDIARLNAMDRNQAQQDRAYNRLAALAGLGPTTATALNNNAANYGAAASAAIGQAGQARADNAINQGNIVNNALGNLATIGVGWQQGLFNPAPRVGLSQGPAAGFNQMLY